MLVKIKFLTLKAFACFNKISFDLFAARRIISKFFFSLFKILSKVLPIDPVEPKMAIFFFHIKNTNNIC